MEPQQLPSLEISEELLTDVQVTENNIKSDLFGVRDPTIAAFCLCYGQKLQSIKVYKVRRPSRQPERVVQFEFLGRNEVFAIATRAMYDARSSLEVQNVNFGELFWYIRNLRTQIRSFI